MRHPAYHLRPNKAAERFVFIEAIRRLEHLSKNGLADYTYHGLGGPFLEDFRLLYEFCPDIGMVSIEADNETYKRQSFHRPSSKVQLIKNDMASYIAQYDPDSTKSVFWLDYTGLEYSCFEEIKALLGLVEEMSMIKVSLRCEPTDYDAIGNECLRKSNAEKFRTQFGNVMPQFLSVLPGRLDGFAEFLQKMLRTAVEQALPPTATTLTFLPVSSFCYSDTNGMFTLTGVVCDSCKKDKVEQTYADWTFANLDWSPPKLIKVPTLSTKERLHLQRLLPSKSAADTALQEALGYLIDDNAQKNEAALKQYATFHRYSPYVLRGVP